MTNLNRRDFLAGAAAAAALPVAGLAEARDTKAPRPEVKTEYPAAEKSAALYERFPDAEPDVGNTGTFDFGVSDLNEGETITATRWGIVRPVVKGGRVVELKPFEYDYAPSPNIQGLAEIPYCEARIRYPMVRESYLKGGPKSREKRGDETEKFVRVSWDKALELVAKEITRMYDNYGPSAIYASNYGWKSTGSVNDPTALQYRLLNLMGGFTGKRNSYSSAAVNTILPYVVGAGDPRSTAWDVVLEHSERVVFWGCNPLVTNDIDWYTTLHNYAGYLRALKKKGTKTYAINPVFNDTAEYMGSEWLAVNPGTDTAVMAAMIYELETTGEADHAFLEKYTSGWKEFRAYLTGEEDGVKKTPEWAAKISGLSAETIRALAHDLKAHRTMLMIGWGIQRIDYGEQFHWMLVTLAAALGQIGLPGGGFGTNYHYSSGGAPLANGPFVGGIPSKVEPARPVKKPWTGSKVLHVAAITDALEHPGAVRDFDGKKETYPHFRMIMWAGGNPFAHHPDTFRLERAWKKVDTVVVTDVVWTATARHADIVLPAATFLEHNDISVIGTNSCDGVVAMHQAIKPQYESRSDYWIYSHLAEKLGLGDKFTEGRTEMQWIEKIYNDARGLGDAYDIEMPDFKTFWEKGFYLYDVPEASRQYVSFKAFREDPQANKLNTETGLIQLFSPKIAGYGYDDCHGHAAYFQPAEGTATATKEYPLALMAPKGRYRMHSQLDCVNNRQRGKIEDREPVWLNPKDAASRKIESGDVVLVKSRRGAMLAGAIVTERVKPGVIVVQHGAWFNPMKTPKGRIDVEGNSNALTIDKPTSKLARGNISSTGNVQVTKWTGELPPVTVFEQPRRKLA